MPPGCIVCPGLVDLAARLREPGFEYRATLESEMAAAAAGGVTSAWPARRTPIRCWTNRAWSKC
jgi:dihydroorotase-like cyclic amidohydrolase